MSLGTTTWRKRNEDKLSRLLLAAQQLNIFKPNIIHIGPGGGLGFLMSHLPSGKKSNWSQTEIVKRGIAKAIETTLRHSEIFDLECCELHNLLYTLAPLNPKEVFVFDKELKVVSAASKLSNYNGFKIPVNSCVLNIETQKIKLQAEIVVAYNVLNRVSDISSSLKNIMESVSSGGILSINHDFTSNDFIKIEDGLYQKV